MKKKVRNQPYFARFLEQQELAGVAAGQTLKFPSETDEVVTMKWPSDDDEDIIIVEE